MTVTVKRLSKEEARSLAGAPSRHSASNEDLRWIIPAMREFREMYRGRPAEAARVVGLAPAIIARWMGGYGYPGKTNVRRFHNACKTIGIEVAE